MSSFINDRTYSFNNRLIVEKYVKGSLRSKEVNGFAMIDQKVSLKGLKLLVEAYMNVNGAEVVIRKGSTVYVKEETLHTQPWAQKSYESDAIGVPFMIVDLVNVEMIVPPSHQE